MLLHGVPPERANETQGAYLAPAGYSFIVWLQLYVLHAVKSTSDRHAAQLECDLLAVEQAYSKDAVWPLSQDL